MGVWGRFIYLCCAFSPGRWYEAEAERVWAAEERPTYEELKRHAKNAKAPAARRAKWDRYNEQRRAARREVSLQHLPPGPGQDLRSGCVLGGWWCTKLLSCLCARCNEFTAVDNPRR